MDKKFAAALVPIPSFFLLGYGLSSEDGIHALIDGLESAVAGGAVSFLISLTLILAEKK